MKTAGRGRFPLPAARCGKRKFLSQLLLGREGEGVLGAVRCGRSLPFRVGRRRKGGRKKVLLVQQFGQEGVQFRESAHAI